MTVHLSDTQRTILTTTCARRGGRVLPITAGLKGEAVRIVLNSLLAKGLIAAAPARRTDEVWRTSDEGTPLTLAVTTAAYEVLGIAKPNRRGRADGSALQASARTPRSGTKQALLIGMLQRPEGATVAEIMAATTWQAHTVRGAIAGALKKRFGLIITADPDDRRGRVYRSTHKP